MRRIYPDFRREAHEVSNKAWSTKTSSKLYIFVLNRGQFTGFFSYAEKGGWGSLLLVGRSKQQPRERLQGKQTDIYTVDSKFGSN